MNFLIIFLLILILFKSKVYIKNYNEDYLDKTNTNIVKGIFIIIVFFSHIRQYATFNGKYDIIGNNFIIFLRQLMVTMFLFYFGYGVYESIKKKKKKYINNIPKKRILKTLINFDICVLMYLILDLIFNKELSVSKFLLSLIAWENIGNSNWYILAILGLYLVTYITFKIVNYEDKKGLILIILLTLIFHLFLSKYKQSYYYDTLFCYPFGIIYSYYKDKINGILCDNKKYLVLFITTILSIVILNNYRSNLICFHILSIVFVLGILLFTFKIKINNNILKWFGENLFWIYMLQRIPMIIFNELGYASHRYKYLIISFIFTIVLTIFVNFITKINIKSKRLFTK